MNKYRILIALVCSITPCCMTSIAEEAEQQVLTAVSGTTLSGYIDTSMGWQFGDKTTSAGRVNDASDRQNGFNLNVAQLRFAKELSDDADTWEAGYAVSTLFGATAREMSYAKDDFALQHAYVDLHAPLGNGLNFRFGAFESLIGLEALETYANPNYSRSYGSYLAHGQCVGGLAEYTFDLNDWMLTLTGGLANAYDNPDSINDRSSKSSRLSYMGAIDLIFPESTGFMQDSEFYFAIVNGIEGNSTATADDDSQPNTVNLNSWFSMPLPVQNLSMAISYDYLGNSSRGGVSPVESSWANAYAYYLIYDLTEKLTLANRIEYTEGTAGTYEQNFNGI